jgi:hypothetical protein
MAAGGIPESFVLAVACRVAYFIAGNYRDVRFKNLLVKPIGVGLAVLSINMQLGRFISFMWCDEAVFRSAVVIDSCQFIFPAIQWQTIGC